ncbi:hypothetical protein LCI18_005902 [Fusarium solani-melongenae]|uniref:Uncharacterized protein n=1 Tax=Fusarium solani subsp. cucurbitae TaxID=2747967 RepID=A0ACD3Z178_FUSSC|nr:hypothetical protein LCI18_005902 [Fusarium solani-melongenae]
MGTGVPLVAQVISDGLASGVATAGFTSSLPPSPSLARIRQLDDPSPLDLYHCTSFVLISPPITSIIMARGNQREKARQANLKEQAKKKSGTNMSGTQMQHAKEANADIMRQKQAAAEARKAAEGKK